MRNEAPALEASRRDKKQGNLGVLLEPCRLLPAGGFFNTSKRIKMALSVYEAPKIQGHQERIQTGFRGFKNPVR